MLNKKSLTAAASTTLCLAAILISNPATHAQTLPAGYNHFTSAVTVYADGTNVVIQANAVPDHKSPYFTSPGDARYEAYNGTNPNWSQNPNHIAAQIVEFRIPANPQMATTHAATPLGPIGVAVNGVPLFNQYAGPNQPLTNEINSFDQYGGHPQQFSEYHYHSEPYALTTTNGKDSLIGYLLDGFPVYGPLENGVTLTSANLDTYHGHFGVTADHPKGIYHYHITADAPYINGTGFYGTAGTVVMTFSNTPTPAATNTPTATPTSTPTPAPSVGGIAEDPAALAPAPAAQPTTSSSSHTTAIAIIAAATLAVVLAAAWHAKRRRARRAIR